MTANVQNPILAVEGLVNENKILNETVSRLQARIQRLEKTLNLVYSMNRRLSYVLGMLKLRRIENIGLAAYYKEKYDLGQNER